MSTRSPAQRRSSGGDGDTPTATDKTVGTTGVVAEPDGTGRHETPVERLDRNWAEILQELRVTQTGIQILTGFLLTVPFQARFADLSTDQRIFYLGLVLLAAVTTGLMVAPVSLHRWLFRKGAKSTLVTAADRFMRIGLVCLALVVSGVVFLVFDVVVSVEAAFVAAGSLLALLVLTWFVLPAVLSQRNDAPDT